MVYMFIYETTNNINGKKYIGQHTTDNIQDGYIGSGVILKQAIDKYGKENFSRKILCHANNKDELNELEKYYIDKFNAIESNEYYNIAEGGYGNPMAGLTDEQMKERSNKISEGLKGKQRSEETKAKISEAMKGENNPSKKPEVKAKISEGNKGKKHSEEWKSKISESAKITMNRPEVKKKISEALKGIQRSEQTKGKISEAKKGKYQGKDNPSAKPILMLDKHTLSPIACFDCIGDGAEYCGKPRYNNSINNCLRGYSKTAYKYIWRYIQLQTL